MKKKLSILFILISTLSCSQKTKSIESKNNFNSIVDSLSFVKNLPDENFYPKGDKIVAKILSKDRKKITPLLIEKIDDTVKSNYLYAGTYYYKVGDISTNIIDCFYNDKEFPIRKLIEQEFYKEKIDIKDVQYEMLYNLVFFNNSEKENYENRKRFKKAVKNWFKKQKPD